MPRILNCHPSSLPGLFQLVLFLMLVSPMGKAMAHGTSMAMLQLNEYAPGKFSMAWTYARQNNNVPPQTSVSAACTLQDSVIRCDRNSTVAATPELTIHDIGQRYSAVVVRLRTVNNLVETSTLSAPNSRVRLAAGSAVAAERSWSTYLWLGVEHILLGIDHLLFVLTLIWLADSIRMLVKAITAFTLAHTVSLLATFSGLIGVPERAVEIAVALSIAVVAVEVLNKRENREGLSTRYPWIIAFGFGLLHGLAFVSVLLNAGLDRGSVTSALLFFNLGVEAGQLLFVGLVLLVGFLLRRVQLPMSGAATTAMIYAVGIFGCLWFADRFAGLITETAPL